VKKEEEEPPKHHTHYIPGDITLPIMMIPIFQLANPYSERLKPDDGRENVLRNVRRFIFHETELFKLL
jgi:hypothetical protein